MYDFKRTGVVLNKHNHDETTVHITIVTKGKVKVYSHDWEIEVVPGQILDFRPGKLHKDKFFVHYKYD